MRSISGLGKKEPSFSPNHYRAAGKKSRVNERENNVGGEAKGHWGRRGEGKNKELGVVHKRTSLKRVQDLK